jgi:hypothetical protein
MTRQLPGHSRSDSGNNGIPKTMQITSVATAGTGSKPWGRNAIRSHPNAAPEFAINSRILARSAGSRLGSSTDLATSSTSLSRVSSRPFRTSLILDASPFSTASSNSLV